MGKQDRPYAFICDFVFHAGDGVFGHWCEYRFFWLFEIPKFESTHLFTFWVSDRLNMTFAEFEVVVDYLHKDVGGALLVWMLISIMCAS